MRYLEMAHWNLARRPTGNQPEVWLRSAPVRQTFRKSISLPGAALFLCGVTQHVPKWENAFIP